MLQQIRSGTSGFRGQTNTEITVPHAVALGALFGQMLKRSAETEECWVAIAHDQRYGAEMLAHAVTTGLRCLGVHVSFFGQLPCGAFSLHVAGVEDTYAGGVYVTGSHMDPERIGIILMNADGTYCTSDITNGIEEELVNFPKSVTPVPYDLCGELSVPDPRDTIKRYLRTVGRTLDTRSIASRGFKILLDAGNGTAGAVARELFENLGCEIVELNEKPKGRPDRKSECRPSSCQKAIQRVRERECVVGFCFDGDADRVLVLDEQGNAIPEDVVGAIFARELLTAGEVCVTPVDSSALIDAVCAEIGARVVRCRIGQPATGEAIRAHNAALAYEASAKYGPRKVTGFPWYDGVLAAAMFLGFMAKKGVRASELSAGLPQYYKMERGIALPAGIKTAVVERVFARALEIYRELSVEVNELDGLRFSFPDGSWLLLRPSGTEPKARIYADSKSEEMTAALIASGEQLFGEAIATCQ